ncbi:MAG TPA: hypothetical protein VI981_00875 [Candidatus Paceibacterota bacterium]
MNWIWRILRALFRTPRRAATTLGVLLVLGLLQEFRPDAAQSLSTGASHTIAGGMGVVLSAIMPIVQMFLLPIVLLLIIVWMVKKFLR